MNETLTIKLMWLEIQDLKKALAQYDVTALATIEERYNDQSPMTKALQEK